MYSRLTIDEQGGRDVQIEFTVEDSEDADDRSTTHTGATRGTQR